MTKIILEGPNLIPIVWYNWPLVRNFQSFQLLLLLRRQLFLDFLIKFVCFAMVKPLKRVIFTFWSFWSLYMPFGGKLTCIAKMKKNPKKFHKFCAKICKFLCNGSINQKSGFFLHFHRHNLSYLLVYRFYQKVQYRPQKVAKTSFWPFIIIICIDRFGPPLCFQNQWS